MGGQHRAPSGDDYEDEGTHDRKVFLAGLVTGWALILLAWWVVLLATS